MNKKRKPIQVYLSEKHRGMLKLLMKNDETDETQNQYCAAIVRNWIETRFEREFDL